MINESTRTIREAESADTDAMVDIALRAWEPVFASFRRLMGDVLFSRMYDDWMADKESQIRVAAAPESQASFLVTDIGDRVVGFVSWHVQQRAQQRKQKGSVAEIGNNAVDPDWQNRGIATSQYKEVTRRCRESGVATIKVSTGLDPSHAPARRAYEKAGFGGGIPMVTYWQDLS